MAYLILNPGATDNKIFDLKPGRNLIGRSEGNDIVILHASLSRRHACIEVMGDQCTVVDLGSSNGTFVNDAPVSQPRMLQDKDSVRCGDVTFVFVQGLMSFVQGHTIVKQIAPEATRVMMKDLIAEGQQALAGALKLKNRESDKRATDKLHILLKVTEILSSPEDIERLLQKTLELLFDIMNVDRAAILMVNPVSGEPELKAMKTGQRLSEKPYSRNIIDHVLKQGVGVLSSDARLDPRFSKAESIVSQSIQALMCVPLKPRDKVIGVLYVDNLSMANLFSEEDLEFLTGFANQAAISIENSQLYKQIEDEAVLRNNFLRFFPPTVIQEISHAKDIFLGAIETEITALFSDISGFTEMSSKMEPRAIVDLLNAYFPPMAEVVFHQGGTLEKYIGDALLAVWGAPIRNDDDADRAVWAAIHMQHLLGKFNEEWAKPRNLHLQIHIGLNTGKVAAGNIGSKDYIQYATIGDTTNVASRICSAAESGEILIAESTFQRLVDKSLPLEPLPPVSVKGKDKPLSLYRIDWKKLDKIDLSTTMM
ncbi:MAG: GAF domain-containing protein [Blastocatellia bacterium]|nr:GAF domain-containing protein [Blastocatellia bacterium]